MSKINDIREQILSDNNNAQSSFESFLDDLDSNHVTELRFDFPLHGDMDFSILDIHGFNKVETVIFEREGDITHLRNLPETITYLEITKQLITEIDNLPTNLETLIVNDNYITKFDASTVPKLKKLIISNNELVEMVNLPETMETIECDNNQLRRLDLANTPLLKTLKCSNNPILVLEHVPDTLTDLVMENNPFIEIDHSKPTSSSNKRINKMFDYRESLNEYFRMKNAYDTKKLTQKRTAFKKGVTRREGKMNARKVKTQCVNCSRNVNTVFSYKNNIYKAECGDRSKPCKLDIQIFSGDYLRLDDMLETFTHEVEDSKQSIIEQKMDTLFKYISESTSAKQFKEEFDQYNEMSKIREEMMESYNKIHNNLDRSNKIEQRMSDVYKIREDILKLLSEYKKSDNREYMISAVEMYVKDLVPALNNMRLLKYDNVFMEISFDSDTPISKMVSYEVESYRKDFLYGNAPKVIKFIVD